MVKMEYHNPDEVSANEMLCRYRERNQIEMNFRDLLRSDRLERIFMQIPERIDAYLYIKIPAYFVLDFLRWYWNDMETAKWPSRKFRIN